MMTFELSTTLKFMAILASRTIFNSLMSGVTDFNTTQLQFIEMTYPSYFFSSAVDIETNLHSLEPNFEFTVS